jgi:DNA polymerase III epsilon subunit-like protein
VSEFRMQEAEADDVITFVGVDIETSGIDLAAGSRLIQIGISTGLPDGDYCRLVRPSDGDFEWNPQSALVHNIPLDDIYSAAPDKEIDAELFHWLLAHGADPDKRVLIAVGWNVQSFDMPFIRHSLPLSGDLISRRSVDLNSVCFTMGSMALPYEGSIPRWSGWKRMSKTYAAEKLAAAGVATNEHDALYDAQAALASWEFLKRALDPREDPPWLGSELRN